MPFANLSETRIHCELEGLHEAPMLVLSNSLGADLTMWDPQLPAFAARFRVLRYDTRGHGQSSVPPGPYSIPQLSRDLIELLDDVGEQRVHFCGLSMGGVIGMHLALHYPERLHRMVLSNTAARIGSDELWNKRIDTIRQGGMEAISVATMERWFTPGFRARAPETIANIERMVLSTPAEGYIACSAALRDSDQRGLVKDIRVPTLVIAGTHDPATTSADGRFLAANIANARYVELAAAHLSNIESSSAFIDEVCRFFAQ